MSRLCVGGISHDSTVIGTPWTKLDGPVSAEALSGVDKYWRCANYLSVGQIYLRSNPLMRPDWTDAKTGEQRDFGRVDVKHRWWAIGAPPRASTFCSAT